MLPAAFPFLRLPLELRNIVYHNLLCDFAPQLESDHQITPEETQGYSYLKHNVSSEILLVNKQIHREAYNVLVKANQFVRVECQTQIPLLQMTRSNNISVVMSGHALVNQFHGYVLSISLHMKGASNTYNSPPSSYIAILSRDLDSFSVMLADGDVHLNSFSQNVALTITVASGALLNHKCPFKDLFTKYFTKRTQRLLLEPLSSRLWDWKTVAIRGAVDPSLAREIRTAITASRWSNHQQVLNRIAAEKDSGSKAFLQKDMQKAAEIWFETTLFIEKVHRGNAWSTLVAHGGEPFLKQIAELYFNLHSNVCHVRLSEPLISTLPHSITALLVQDSFQGMMASTKMDHWNPGFKFSPTRMLWAKFNFRRALSIRLLDDGKNAANAVRLIEQALLLAPGDRGIVRERVRVRTWAEGL
ncbi:hypothetical protein B0J11DRAFT_455011 [Dendryphion nanum]|uniref:Uncharacterized protein n=1 Tax=Dendryphion nanum TaxID=256645 RepID=A0A9P9IXR0_9PLEO|nr:hypothetical protein B0J11DRAFT_455011 [Dendryphion nanum]